MLDLKFNPYDRWPTEEGPENLVRHT